MFVRFIRGNDKSSVIKQHATIFSQRWLQSFSLTGVPRPVGPGVESEVLSAPKEDIFPPVDNGDFRGGELDVCPAFKQFLRGGETLDSR